MKKLSLIIVAALITCGAAFAKPSLSQEVQLHTGVGFNSATYTTDTNQKIEVGSTAFVIGAEAWFLYDINKHFNFGFMSGFDAAIGGTSTYKVNGNKVDIGNKASAYHFNFIIGPAATFKLNDVVHFNGMFGFSWMIDDSYWTKNNVTDSGLHFSGCGIAFDLQAKFLPKKQFSPLAGYRLTINWANHITTESKSGTQIIKVSDKQKNVCTSAGVIYLGCAYNF